MSMLKELKKKQDNKSLEKFSNKTSDYGKHYKHSPEKYADEISERMIITLKKNLSQQGIAAMGSDVTQ